MADVRSNRLEALREQLARIEAGGRVGAGVLPFGVEALDHRLPGGGLRLGALHEFAGEAEGAAAALFAASILARAEGSVLWCVSRRDLFAPALAQAGLSPERVIHVEAGEERDALFAAEEGLRHGGLAGVAVELSRLSLTVSRRLQLAAETSGALCLVVRRWRRPAEAVQPAQPSAAVTRWRIAHLPSADLRVEGRIIPGLGRARWRLDLERCRGAAPFSLDVEAPDETGQLSLPAALVDRPLAPRAPDDIRAIA